MSKQLIEKTMVERVLAIAEILSMVATQDEVRAANQVQGGKVILLSKWQGQQPDVQLSPIEE